MDEQDRKRSVVQKTVWKGVSFGSVLAMVISYCNWHSVGGPFSTACSAGRM